MWEQYEPNVSDPYVVKVSPELRDAVKKYAKDKGFKMQHVFDQAVVCLWRIYNGNRENNEAASPGAEMKVRNILKENKMPGKLPKKNTPNLTIAFKGDYTFDFVCKLENLYMFHGTFNFIRRVLSWFLRENGYIEDEIEKNMKKYLIV